MTLFLIRILLDFGLLILIWIVQLVIYPSFSHMPEDKLVRWHQQYTKRFSIVVFPLMMGQLIIIAIQIFSTVNWYTFSSLLLVMILWGITFFQFAPLHGRISKGTQIGNAVEQLINLNWPRTALWTILFVLSLTYYLL